MFSPEDLGEENSTAMDILNPFDAWKKSNILFSLNGGLMVVYLVKQ